MQVALETRDGDKDLETKDGIREVQLGMIPPKKTRYHKAGSQNTFPSRKNRESVKSTQVELPSLSFTGGKSHSMACNTEAFKDLSKQKEVPLEVSSPSLHSLSASGPRH